MHVVVACRRVVPVRARVIQIAVCVRALFLAPLPLVGGPVGALALVPLIVVARALVVVARRRRSGLAGCSDRTRCSCGRRTCSWCTVPFVHILALRFVIFIAVVRVVLAVVLLVLSRHVRLIHGHRTSRRSRRRRTVRSSQSGARRRRSRRHTHSGSGRRHGVAWHQVTDIVRINPAGWL